MCGQLGRVDRLGEIIIDPGLIAGDFVIHLGFGGKHQNGDIGGFRVSAQAAGNFITIQVRHHHIKKDYIWDFGVSHLERLGSIVGRQDLISLAFQHQPDQTQGLNVIIYD